MTAVPAPRALLAAAAAAAAALLLAAPAFPHASVLPATGLAGGQLYALSVPSEIDGARTTRVVLTVPEGFTVGEFVDVPGWSREAVRTGSGHEGGVASVAWTANAGGTAEGVLFQFTGSTASPGTYRFVVVQTYSDGTVVDWAGDEDAELPASFVTTKSSLEEHGPSSSALAALAVSALALTVALAAMLRGRNGRR